MSIFDPQNLNLPILIGQQEYSKMTLTESQRIRLIYYIVKRENLGELLKENKATKENDKRIYSIWA